MVEQKPIATLRHESPLILNITNFVVANYVANGLLALGASPIMSNSIEEIEELSSLCQAVVINIGTVDSLQLEIMLKAGKKANQLGIPVVLDPVGVGATKYRKLAVHKLLQEINFTLIRGNAGEIAYLADATWQAKGVDAGKGDADLTEIAHTVASRYHCIVALSGEVDVVSNGIDLCKIYNGTPLFPKITGSGCLLGAVCAAYLHLNLSPFQATITACTHYALAGEMAAKMISYNKTGQFYTALLDQLANIDDSTFIKYARVEYV